MVDATPYIIGLCQATGAVMSLSGLLVLLYDASISKERRSPGHISLAILFFVGLLFESLLILRLFISPSYWEYWLINDLAHLFGLLTASSILILAIVVYQVHWMYRFPFIVSIPFLGVFVARLFFGDSVFYFEIYYIIASVFVTILAAIYFMKLYLDLKILNHGIYISSSLILMAGNIFEIVGRQMMLELLAVGAMLHTVFFLAMFATTLNLLEIFVQKDIRYA
ncbi:MAG: hypothetical protein ACFFDI_20445 [Promethearchaeota archaeon]